MATRDLPPSGTIKLSEVKAEFGKGNNLLDYLGEGGVTATPPLKLTDFYGKSAGPKPPEMIGGTGYYWRYPGRTQDISHTFDVAASAGDTIVVAFSTGNFSYQNPVTITVNDNATASPREYSSSKTGLTMARIAFVVLPNSIPNITVRVTCPTREMIAPGFHVYAIKGSFVGEVKNNTAGKYYGVAGAKPYITNVYYDEEVADGFTFVVTKNASNKNWTSQWWDYQYSWADGGDWDYKHKQEDRSDNDSESSLRVMPAGSIVKYRRANDSEGSTNAFCCQHFRPASSRLSPAKIMEQQFRQEKAREALRKEAEE